MKLIHPSHEILTKVDGVGILKRIELAGRVCYKSEAKITETSAKDFIARIIKSGHHSVIEHENISVRFVCDRGVTHEIVRHRLAVYSQESTRYCNYKGGVVFIIPSWCKDLEWAEYMYGDEIDSTISKPSKIWLASMFSAESDYIDLLKEGWSPQQARSVLPNSLKTEIVMTCNLREWKHVLNLRCSKAAHPQMRELMAPLLVDFKSIIPVIFDDI